MHPQLSKLQPYPFERLGRLKAGIEPPKNRAHIALSIGEPQHPAPQFVCDEYARHMAQFAKYPMTAGSDSLRETISTWVMRRFKLPAGSIDPQRHVLPVNGTREALFAFAQCVVDNTTAPLVIMPNPFYQIYEGAALLAGAEPFFLATTRANSFVPDFEHVPEAIWKRCQLVYLCSPGNPTGKVLSFEVLKRLLDLSDRYSFVIAADECYSELYPDESAPPVGLLEAAARLGQADFRRCVAFHSLSKRSNLPGLRSGFVAGDATILKSFLRYRTYHGSALPLPAQYASIAAWNDETHVRANRDAYREKFRHVLDILSPVMDVSAPDASFYLWPRLPIDGETFAKKLYAEENVTVLPGAYLSRESGGDNPGKNYVRIALVPSLEECMEAARRIRALLERLR